MRSLLRFPDRLASLAALASLALCGCFAPSALAVSTGGISGKVTDVTTHKPIEGIEVCTFSLTAEGPEEESPGNSGCAQSNTAGEYTISGLNAGDFAVIFGSFLSASNYVVQLYNGVSLMSEPTRVTVKAAATTNAINAELQEGSAVSGRITNASTGAPVERVVACALRATGPSLLEPTACARSDANGEYTIRGIPDGTFYIWFFSSSLAAQYYPGKASFAEASTVTISAPKEVKTGFDAALNPNPPEASGEGPELGGPPGSGFGPQLPGSPLGGMPTGSKLAVSLSSQRIGVVHDAIADLKLACAAATSCHGKLVLTFKHTVRHGGKMLVKTVTLGAVRYSLRHGQKATVRVRLDAKARRLLRSAKGSLVAQLVISQRTPSPRGVELESVVLVERGAPARR